MAKIRARVLFVGLAGVFFSTAALPAQRGGPPRRIANPETIQLAGGGRVEFKSFASPSLGKDVDYSVFLPPSYDREPHRRYPVIYFLHGLFNDYTSWAVERYGDMPAHIEKLMVEGKIPEFVMIHPSGDRGFYTDSADGQHKYETVIDKDMIEEAEKSFRIRSDRSGRAIAGTSMGGYGALKIAMKHPQLFSCVAAGSPIVFLGDDPLAVLPKADGENRFAQYLTQLIGGVFGNPVDREHWKANSLEYLARTADLDGLRIYFFYGTADRYGQWIPLEKGVRTLDRILTERGIPHTFKIIENGPHGWDLVEEDLEDMLDFLTKGFGGD